MQKIVVTENPAKKKLHIPFNMDENFVKYLQLYTRSIQKF